MSQPPCTPSKKHRYRIVEGGTPVSPRRTKDELGVGGELWRLGTTALAEAEKIVKEKVNDVAESGASIPMGLVARHMAGVRAEARAGYAIDGRHEWLLRGRHSMYIRPSEARVPTQTLFLEDVMDALHALDRISHANIVCAISFPQTQPCAQSGQPGKAIVHQFGSRAVMQWHKYQKTFDEMVDTFTAKIAQSAVDHQNKTLKEYQDRYIIPRRLGNPPPPMPIKPIAVAAGPGKTPCNSLSSVSSISDFDADTDEESEVDMLISSLCLPVPTMSRAGTPVPTSSQQSVLDVQDSDSVRFGAMVEEGLASLHLEESVALKIKLISVVAEESTWVGRFEKLGLSHREATLLTVLLKSERRSD